jgi:hypothetical protein
MESPDGRCSAERWKAIHEDLRVWGLMGWTLAFPGILLLGLVFMISILQVTPGGAGPAWLPEALALAGLLLYTAGLTCYARYKGHSGLWGAAALGCVFGLLFLRFLPKRCRHCSLRNSSTGFDCLNCRAPI